METRNHILILPPLTSFSVFTGGSPEPPTPSFGCQRTTTAWTSPQGLILFSFFPKQQILQHFFNNSSPIYTRAQYLCFLTFLNLCQLFTNILKFVFKFSPTFVIRNWNQEASVIFPVHVAILVFSSSFPKK